MSRFDDSFAAEPVERGIGRAGDDAIAGMTEAPLTRRKPGDLPRMIIVEDAPLIALDLAETMKELGFEVQATVFTHDQALAEIRRSVPQFAVVDLHLGSGEDAGQRGEALLSVLDEHGCRCLVFSGDETACRRVSERYPHFSVLAKPAQAARLAREVERLRASGRP